MSQDDVIEIIEPQPWDEFVAQHPQGHLLQSYAWGQFRGAFGWKSVRLGLARDGNLRAGAQVLFRSSPLGAIAYIPKGPMAPLDDEKGLAPLISEIEALCRRHRAFFLKVEPNASQGKALPELGFRTSLQCYQPKATLVVDLTPSLDDIAAQQKPKTRYNIGLAARRGVTVRQGGPADLPALYPIMADTARRDGFIIRAPQYYQLALEVMGDRLRLFLAEYQGQLLAGIFVSCFGPEAIYLYGASSNQQRSLMPNHLLQWEAMKWAKEQGCARYDLWGIPEAATLDEGEEAAPGDDPGKNLWGVYRFKAGFGARPVRFAGSFDYVFSPGRYFLWQRLLPLYLRWRGGGVAD